MYYVQRGADGKVQGIFNCPQPQEDGSSLTEKDPLPDDHPDMLEFRAKTRQIRTDQEAKFSRLMDLVKT